MKFPSAFALCLIASVCSSAEPTVAQRILEAGNADRDEERLKILEDLAKRNDLDESLRNDLDVLIGTAREYISNPRLDYFGSDVHKAEECSLGVREDSPLYPIALFYEARMLFWVTLEYGNWWSFPKERRKRFAMIRPMFERVRTAFPGNQVCRMYLGEPLPRGTQYAPNPNAPDWANYQRAALEHLADIIIWWITNRMQDNGEFGGGWDDDCEMWRWWAPVLVGFDDPKITAAQTRFSRALLSQPHMQGGYTSTFYDVEHTSEGSCDALMPMLHLEPENPEWRDAAMRLAELMRTVWCGVNERGFFQFRSTYFNVERVSDDPRKACDTVYHTRAIAPALLLWQRTGDPALGELFSRWMDTWADASARAERGKPAGVIPSAIHWPDGSVGGLGKQWWRPENHTDSQLYVWPSAMGQMMDTLLLTHHMTHDRKYLEPLLSMAQVRLDYLRQPHQSPPEPGSRAWCGQYRGTQSTAAKYKLVTGGSEFDNLLALEAGAYLKTRLTGDFSELTRALQVTARAFSINFPGYTSEVRFTDRVLRFPRIFRPNGMNPQAATEIPIPQYNLLYATVTGDPGDGVFFPTNAVRWFTPPREIAAMVTKAGDRQFEAEVFHFGKNSRDLEAEFYLLKPGTYELTVIPESGVTQKPVPFTVRSPRTHVSVTLPPKVLCKVQVGAKRDGRELFSHQRQNVAESP